jgi:Alcohol dehydrogenase GroES-like domain
VREPRNRVVQVRRFGGPDGLEVVDAPLPTAGRGEARVRVLASGLEYTDVVIRRRLYPQTMRCRPPFVLGYDVVGQIDQLGDGVSGFELGDRAADLTVLGSNAAYCTLRADRLTRVPAGVWRGRLVAGLAMLDPDFQLRVLKPLRNSPANRRPRLLSGIASRPLPRGPWVPSRCVLERRPPLDAAGPVRDSNRRSPLEPRDLAMTETPRGFRRPARTWRHVKALRRRSILRA